MSGIALLAPALLGAAVAVGDANRGLAFVFGAGWLAGSGVMLARLRQLRGSTVSARLLLWLWLSTSICLATVPFCHLPA